MIVLTNDPSLTAWGYVVINYQGGDVKNILDSGCIKTESRKKKLRIRAGDDLVRRIKELVHVLLDMIDTYAVDVIISELPHGSQNYSAAVMIGACAGVVVTLGRSRGIPVEWYNEADAKECVLRKRSASKKEMLETIKALYRDVPWTGIEYKDEAVADALAIFHTARKNSPIFQILSKK